MASPLRETSLLECYCAAKIFYTIYSYIFVVIVFFCILTCSNAKFRKIFKFALNLSYFKGISNDKANIIIYNTHVFEISRQHCQKCIDKNYLYEL